jgi:hypothetical protein
MRLRPTGFIAGMLMLAASVPAAAQTSLTLYLGYAASEGIDNATTNAKATVESAVNYSAALDIGLDPSRQLQVFYSQQNTELSPGGGVAPFDFTVRYLHVGGTFFVDGSSDAGIYVVGGIGATQLSPNLSGLDSEIKPSLNLGVGYQWPLGKALALRAEARGFFTVVNSSSGLFCSGGCIVVLKGDAFVQGAAMLGVSGRF